MNPPSILALLWLEFVCLEEDAFQKRDRFQLPEVLSLIRGDTVNLFDKKLLIASYEVLPWSLLHYLNF